MMKKSQCMTMKIKVSVLLLLIVAAVGSVSAQTTKSKTDRSVPQKKESSVPTSNKSAEQELLNLSKEKWRWMSERKADSLDALFHDKAVFVHMGATMSKTQELDVIRSGNIQYKTVEIQEASVRFVDKTAILLNKIRLVAVVGGNEVTNPFMVTEVYVEQSGTWKLASLSFTRLLTQ
jgi:4-carboxymuconolactone decarboxylase